MSITVVNEKVTRILRFIMYVGVLAMSARFLDSSLAMAYYFATLGVVSYTAYVSIASDVSPLLILANLWFVQLSTYLHLSSSEIWFSFYNSQLLLSVLTGVAAMIVLNMIVFLIMGSLLYGNLETFSDELEKERREQHTDPFGDKHAQNILNNQE